MWGKEIYLFLDSITSRDYEHLESQTIFMPIFLRYVVASKKTQADDILLPCPSVVPVSFKQSRIFNSTSV